MTASCHTVWHTPRVSDEQDNSTDPGQAAPAGGEGTVRTFIPAGRTEADTALSIRNNKPEEQTVPVEIGGRRGPDPTRFGDWELKGRCIDF
ncbi:MAG TPA: DUF1674 domain-containing protein [Woeseiaceae bacterium]|nr:DUF1674 domain-containing protein [Woeseiaceae bacterium]